MADTRPRRDPALTAADLERYEQEIAAFDEALHELKTPEDFEEELIKDEKQQKSLWASHIVDSRKRR